MTTLVLVLKKIESEDKTSFYNFYSRSKAEIIVNESDIENVFESIYSTVTSNVQKSLGKVQARLWIQSFIILLVFQSIIF